MFVIGCVESRRVEGRVEPEKGDMNDPDPIEIDQEMAPRTRFLVGFEKDFVPSDLPKFFIAFGRWSIYEAHSILEHDALDAFRVPEKLVDVVVANYLVVVSFTADILSFINLVTLISAVVV